MGRKHRVDTDGLLRRNCRGGCRDLCPALIEKALAHHAHAWLGVRWDCCVGVKTLYRQPTGLIRERETVFAIALSLLDLCRQLEAQLLGANPQRGLSAADLKCEQKSSDCKPMSGGHFGLSRCHWVMPH